MKKVLIIIALLVLIGIFGYQSLFTGEAGSPGDFFPLTEGSYWKYRGEGNEYASFIREVVAVQGEKAQVRENNGGTVTVSIYRTTDDAVTRIYFQGEAYEDSDFLNQEPNETTIILQAPLKEGTTWQTQSGEAKITDTEATVETFTGTFTDCIEVEVTSANYTVHEYYKEQVGLVRREFLADDAEVTSTLEEYLVE